MLSVGACFLVFFYVDGILRLLNMLCGRQRQICISVRHYIVHEGFCHLTSRVRLTVDGFSVTLPSRFKFSASIPKVFQWFIGNPTDEEFALAACIHDYLHKLRYDRDTTDEVFNILLSWQMLNTTKRLLMYYAVRVGGHAFYAARANNNKLSTRFWRWLVTIL